MPEIFFLSPDSRVLGFDELDGIRACVRPSLKEVHLALMKHPSSDDQVPVGNLALSKTRLSLQLTTVYPSVRPSARP